MIRETRLGGNTYLNQVLQVNPYQPELGRTGWIDLLVRALGNAQRYTALELPNGLLGAAAAGEAVDWTGRALGLALLLLAVYGVVRLRRHRAPIGGYLAGAIGLLLLWPESWFGIRFLVPIIPLLLFALLVGVYSLLCRGWHLTGLPGRPPALLLLAFLFALIPDARHAHALAEYGTYPKSWQNYLEVARWVRENADAEAVVCCRKPAMFYLVADRFVTTYRNTPDHGELLADLRAKGVDYVVVDNLDYTTTRRYLIPAIERHADRFRRVYALRDPDTWLLEMLE